MVKQLVDLCLSCIAQNLNTISNVGKHLPTRHKEKLLQRLVDHNMLTAEYLPHVTYHLFSPSLRTVSFNNCDQISDRLLIQLDACQCRLERITLDSCNSVTDVGITALLSHQSELQSLTLKELPHLTCTGLENVGSENLRDVNLRQCSNLSDRGVISLVTKNPSICRLSLAVCYKITNEVIPVIATSLENRLEHLDLSSLHTVSDSDLITLSQQCKNLRELMLHGCNRVTSAGLSPLFKECTNLQNLDVSFCYKLQETEYKDVLTQLPVGLKVLVLSGLQLEGENVRAIVARLPKLHTLRLCGINSITEDMGEEIFKAVGSQLTCLDMTGCHQIMTDQLLKYIIRYCTALEDFSLGFCMKLKGEPLKGLFKHPQRAGYLILLRLSGCKEMTFEVLSDMSQSCCNLEQLYLAGIKSVDDSLLYSIANNMPHLRNISLKSCVGSNTDQVTDNGIVEVARCCPLQDVCLSGIHNITDKSIFALANSCPDLKTLFVSGCTRITGQATRYLEDVCNERVCVYHRIPNADPNLVMGKNLDTGEFCRVDQLDGRT